MISGSLYVSATSAKGKGDNAFHAALLSLMLLLISVVVFLFFDLIVKGLSGLSLSSLTQNPIMAGRSGGIFPVILSTTFVVGLAILISAPISFATGLFLSYLANQNIKTNSFLRSTLEILAAIPSIIYGLFGNAVFTLFFGFGYSILSGAFTLACMILPFLIRISEEAFNGVSLELKLNATSLGLSKFRIARTVLIPTALPALLTGVVLSVGRALSETAALLFTSGYSLREPQSLLDPGRVISVHIYELAMNVVGGEQKAYESATLLIFIMMLIGFVSSLLTKHLRAK